MKVEIYPLKRREEKGIGKLLPKEPRTITDVRNKKKVPHARDTDSESHSLNMNKMKKKHEPVGDLL